MNNVWAKVDEAIAKAVARFPPTKKEKAYVCRDAVSVLDTMRLNRHFVQRLLSVALLLFLSNGCAAQQPADNPNSETAAQSKPIQVNWLYGAYLPRNAELVALTNQQRKQLYLRQTYLTWGIYFKTAVFSLADQASNSPMEWGGGIGAYGERFASRFGQFAIQNTFSATGNYVLGYEPRYERCRCSGVWPRVRHALIRNFVTYNSTEHDKRPQIALYAGAMGAGMVASTWSPERNDLWRSGYQSVLTQAAFGSAANLVGEFAPEIARLLRRRKQTEPAQYAPHPD